jgi:hypothetical protein
MSKKQVVTNKISSNKQQPVLYVAPNSSSSDSSTTTSESYSSASSSSFEEAPQKKNNTSSSSSKKSSNISTQKKEEQISSAKLSNNVNPPLSPMKIKYETVQYEIDNDFTLQEFYGSEDNSLKNKGRLIMRVDKGDIIRVGGSNINDFQNLRKDQLNGKHDLVQKMEVLVVSTWPQAYVVEFPTCAAIGNEFFRGGKKYITHTIPAGTFSSTNTQYRFTINRDIPESMKKYANAFPGYTPDNIETGVHRIEDVMFVPMNNPILMYHNTKYPEEAITKPNIASHFKNSAALSIERGEECIAIAKENLSSRIPLGNVNNKFKVIISGTQSNREKSMGEKHKGLANVHHLINADNTLTGLEKHPHSGLPVEDHAMNQNIPLKMYITITYARLDGKEF